MKLAIVCDDLIQFGGSEKVVEALLQEFSDAELFTTVISKRWKKLLDTKKVVYHTSFLQKFPFVEKLNRYYSIFLLHILALETFDFSRFDMVLSVSSRYAHFINTKPYTKHVCYMNTPGRMFWESSDYFEAERYGKLSFLKNFGDQFIRIPLSLLRVEDYFASKRIDILVTNSIISKNRIKKYYGLDVDIIHPFMNVEKLVEEATPANLEYPYFLILTRLASWKRMDIAVQACLSLGKHLVIAGEGPDMDRLKSIANHNHLITFLGYVSDFKKIELIKGCEALINTQREDFGIVPLEVMYCGKPVIAFGSGGALETVVDGKTGVFFDKQTSESLSKTLVGFDAKHYSSSICKDRALDFDKRVFIDRIKKLLYS